MAERSVFITKEQYPFFEEIRVHFDWFPGFALSQQRKSQISLHKNFLLSYPSQKVLEVSSASLQSLGASLSAMNLKKLTIAGTTTVESAFQSSRIYGDIGPFPEYMFLTGKECKKRVKKRSCGMHSDRYIFDGLEFYAPEHYISLFYNYVYLNALCEENNQFVVSRLIDEHYTAFSDLATRSLNSQARSCAIFISLVKNGLVDKVKDYDSYLQLFRTLRDGKAVGKESYEGIQLLKSKKGVELLSPIVPCQFTKEQTEKYYKDNCSKLTNLKTPENFLDKTGYEK